MVTLMVASIGSHLSGVLPDNADVSAAASGVIMAVWGQQSGCEMMAAAAIHNIQRTVVRFNPSLPRYFRSPLKPSPISRLPLRSSLD